VAEPEPPASPRVEDILKQIREHCYPTLLNDRCPCPESRASDGTRCGKRSAYCKAAGKEPLCFVSEVPKEYIELVENDPAALLQGIQVVCGQLRVAPPAKVKMRC
jgi:hypothetical protein